MSVEVENEIDLSFLVDERTEDPCEHSEHGTRGDLHAGPGEWLVRLHHDCGVAPETLLLCDKNVKLFADPRLSFVCHTCGEQGIRPEDIYTILGRKGVDF